jgi:hypothetical protein
LIRPSKAADAAAEVLAFLGPLSTSKRWVLGAVAAGVLPILVCWLAGWPGQRFATGLFLFPFYLPLVLTDRQRAGFASVLIAFSCHSLLAIALAALDPTGASTVMPGGEAYWNKNIYWIRTGFDPEYEVLNWLPAHLQHLASMSFFSVTSFGLIPLFQGLYEIDVMNFYVGRLIPLSVNPLVALLVGWHTWAVLRGVAYTRIVFEVSSYSLEKLTGVVLSTPRRRRLRWTTGLVLLSLDGLLKFLFLGAVREVLQSNLIPS